MKRIKTIAIYLCLFSLFPVLVPHIIAFALSRNKKLILWDTQRIMEKRSVKLNIYIAVFYVILVDSFYRKLFYKRIGTLSYLFNWYLPGSKTFYPICDNIGGGIYLAHPVSTFLNAKKIGTNFSCRQNTTIGNKREGAKDARPTIGNNVELGANVCIIGNVHVGDNVIIGAGCVVVKDVPNNSIVVGNPGRVISVL